jgi:predicted dehydrogenase
LRVAVVGAGHLGRIHAKLLKQHSSVEIVGVVDPVPAARNLVESDLQLPTYAEIESVIDRIDACVIAAPTTHHYRIAARMLRQSVHCLVEKPLVLSGVEAVDLVELAEQMGVVLQVGHVERFNPAWQAAQSLLHDTRYVETQRCSGFSGRSTDIGVVLDLMIHDLDLVLQLTDSPIRRVEAFGQALFGKHEDWASARIVFDDGCVASLKASRVAPQPLRTMHAVTAQGWVDIDFSGPTARVIEPCSAIASHQVDFDQLAPERKQSVREGLFSEWLPKRDLEVIPCNAILEEQKDFVQAIESHGSPQVTGVQAARTLEVAERILTSIERHAWYGPSSQLHQMGPTALPMLSPESQVLEFGSHQFETERRKAA